MKWAMELEEIEAVLEKIWDLHDKLSDAIHSITRAHFLNTTTVKRNPHPRKNKKDGSGYGDDDHHQQQQKKPGSGYVFVKEFRVDNDDVQEAKSLYAIRTALENLEDQLEFFHTVQTQQRAQRDAAIARLEQSRIILAMRLAEHQGQKFKVIEEAQALVGDVRDTSRFVAPEHLYNSTSYPSGDSYIPPQKGNINKPNALVSFFLSSFNLVSKSLKLDHTVGILGNAALLALSMIAFVHLNHVGGKEKYTLDLPELHDSSPSTFGRDTSRVNRMKGNHELDVMLARG